MSHTSTEHRQGVRIAIDLGATSGRIMLGAADGGVREFRRFPTPLLRLKKGVFWDFGALFASVLQGLSQLTAADGPFLSLSCDSWAQDFGLLDASGRLLERPYSYRDTQCELHSDSRLAFLEKHRPKLVRKASRLLHMADLVHFRLCGAIRPNYSLVAISRLPPDHPLLGEIADGEIVGRVSHPELPCLRGVPVVSGAGHDTAAAFLSARPAPGQAFLSLGTWFMVAAPCGRDADLPDGFDPLPLPGGGLARTCGGMGMWPFQKCVEQWKERGDFPGYEALTAAAEAADSPGALSPQTPELYSPDNMEETIWRLLRYKATPAQITRLVFEGLARDIGAAVRRFREPFRQLIFAGGPSVNPLLGRLLQKELPCPVVRGEREAATVGNLAMQREVCP